VLRQGLDGWGEATGLYFRSLAVYRVQCLGVAVPKDVVLPGRKYEAPHAVIASVEQPLAVENAKSAGLAGAAADAPVVLARVVCKETEPLDVLLDQVLAWAALGLEVGS
jgi:hypothetical protein